MSDIQELEVLGSETQTITKYRCRVCTEQFGAPEGTTIHSCPSCYYERENREQKRKVHEAQMVGIKIYRALLKHRHETDLDGVEPTEHDLELWSLIDTIDVPNDSPSGVLGIIQGGDDA